MRARERRAAMIFVTGRPPRWMPGRRRDGRHGAAVCANGAMVYDLGSGEIIRQHALDRRSADGRLIAMRGPTCRV